MDSPEQIPVLCYHSIDPTDSLISVEPSRFAAQMRCLKRNGFRTLTIGELIEWRKNKGVLSGRPCCIVFDDGYESNYTSAFPVLEELGFQATIFLATDYCGHMNTWGNQERSIPPLRMLSWSNIVEMSRHGIQFGSHTKSHPRLADLDRKQARDEMIGAKAEIEDKTGKPADFLSYPFGSFNNQTKEIAQAAFEGAVSTRVGKVRKESDLYALERINMAGRLLKAVPINVASFRSFDLYIGMKKFLDVCKGSRRRDGQPAV